MLRTGLWAAALVAAVLNVDPASAASQAMAKGRPDLKSAGALAFGPDGVLFVGDSQSAAVFAIQTADQPTAGGPVEVSNLGAEIAGRLGTTADQIAINDLAVNPQSGHVYLSVSRGRGPDAAPVLLRVGDGEITEVALDDVAFAKRPLPNPPEDREVGQGGRRRNDRQEAITDMVFIHDRLYVAGLSNEEFASKMHALAFPFAADEKPEGASIEIFHGSHGQFETRSPIRTFAGYDIGDEPHLLAAYTCTPLVKIPVAMLSQESKVRGATVAELGNHNRPLDMVVYRKPDGDFLLMANNARGMMKIPLGQVGDAKQIVERISDKAGLEYDTIEGLEGVVQLDLLDGEHAVILVEGDGGLALRSIDLP